MISIIIACSAAGALAYDGAPRSSEPVKPNSPIQELGQEIAKQTPIPNLATDDGWFRSDSDLNAQPNPDGWDGSKGEFGRFEQRSVKDADGKPKPFRWKDVIACAEEKNYIFWEMTATDDKESNRFDKRDATSSTWYCYILLRITFREFKSEEQRRTGIGSTDTTFYRKFDYDDTRIADAVLNSIKRELGSWVWERLLSAKALSKRGDQGEKVAVKAVERGYIPRLFCTVEEFTKDSTRCKPDGVHSWAIESPYHVMTQQLYGRVKHDAHGKMFCTAWGADIGIAYGPQLPKDDKVVSFYTSGSPNHPCMMREDDWENRSQSVRNAMKAKLEPEAVKIPWYLHQQIQQQSS